MKIVSLQSQKGGAGKTTLALNLAIAAELSGRAAVVIDLDPQASAAGWGDLRRADSPAIVAVPPARLAHALRTAEENGADLVFIDTAPHAGGDALAAARAADLVLIPCRPALFDLRAIGATADIVQLTGKPAYVILNAAPPGATRLIEDARQAVAAQGLALAPVAISQRATFAHALTAGLSAQEHEPHGKAAEEIAQLYGWLAAELMPSRRHGGKAATEGR